jgi:hypothetical protein
MLAGVLRFATGSCGPSGEKCKMESDTGSEGTQNMGNTILWCGPILKVMEPGISVSRLTMWLFQNGIPYSEVTF